MTSDARTPNRVRQLGGRRKYETMVSEEAAPGVTLQLEQVTDKINQMVVIKGLPNPPNFAAVGFSGGVQLRWDDLAVEYKQSLAGSKIWRANFKIDANTEFDQNSDKKILAELVKTTTFTDLSCASETPYIYWVENINHDGAPSYPSGGAIATKTSYGNCPLTLSDSISIIADASLGYHFRVNFSHSISGGRTLSVINPKCGQKIIFEMIQSSSGSDTLGLTANFGLGTDISTVVLSTVASK